MAKLIVTINSEDVTNQIKRNTFRIEDILTRQINRCTFKLQKWGSTHNFTPKVGQEVIVTDTDSTKIFGGIITKFDQVAKDYKILDYNITCNDFGRFLSRFLVNQSFTDQTIAQIINTIFVDKGLNTAGFTQNNVNGENVVAFISFKYEPVDSVLSQLADLINFDWYVDYDKDLHFIAKSDELASFDVQDTDGSYLQGSLIIRKDNSQVKNVIIVRGSEYLGDTFTTEFLGDGTKSIFELGYRYKDLSVTLSGDPLTVGLDFIDAPETKDVLWNFQEKRIKFRDLDIPSNGATVRVGGRPFLPVIVKVSDKNSIDTMVSVEGGTGEYEYVIIDKSIETREGARERGAAELQSYKDTLVEAEFQTYNSGLIAGQQITIDSDLYGINASYIITRVTYKIGLEPDEFVYKVNLVSTKTLGIIDFLRQQLKETNKEIVVRADEILDVVEAFPDETITMIETVTSELVHNLQEETITMNETFTAQSLNFPTSFVLGPFTPAGAKRLFLITDSSGLE